MDSKKIDLRSTGIALLVATGVSVAVILVGQVADFPESGVNRVSQVLFFGTFLGVYQFKRRRPVSSKQ